MSKKRVAKPKSKQLSVTAKNPEQKELIKAIYNSIITFVKGAPGTGKTYLAVSLGLEALCSKKYEQLLFTRPVIEAAGERLGFLPGSMEEKIDPYMIPIFDTLLEYISDNELKSLLSKDKGKPSVRILPLAYMRGVSFKNSYCVVDEAQNTTPEQMHMLLTRIGEGSKLVICGDVRQSDVHTKNGLEDAFQILQGIDNVSFVTLTQQAIVRHSIIGSIEQRYESKRDTK